MGSGSVTTGSNADDDDDDDDCLCACTPSPSGRRGVFTGASGLQIAYVSGREALQEPAPAHCFTPKDLLALVAPLVNNSKFRGVDILLTSQWPRGVWQFGNNPVRPSACSSYFYSFEPDNAFSG